MDTFDASELPDWDSVFGSEDSYADKFQQSIQFKSMQNKSSQRSDYRLPSLDFDISSVLSEVRKEWTSQQHKKFVDAVVHLGVQYASPESIVKQMDVEGLTCENVAIHLQRYLIYWKRTRPKLPFDDHAQEIGQYLDDDLLTSEPQRLIWDILLHRTFVEALAQLGINYAKPEKIMQLMNVKDLKLGDVVSHIQRYRPYLMGLANDVSAAEQAEEKTPVISQLEGTNMPVLEEHIFHKVLTIHDVSILDIFSVPKEHAEKYFPSLTKEKIRLLNFVDPTGKLWQFPYSYWTSGHRYVLIGGWIDFVKEKKLVAGDTVSFGRKVGDISEDKFLISWIHKADSIQNPLPSDSALHLDQTLIKPALSSGIIADNASVPFTPSPSLNTNSPRNPSFDVMVVDDAPSLFTPTTLSLYSPLNNSFDEMVVDDALAPFSPSLSLSPGPSLDKSFVGMTANDALCYCALFPHNYEFEKDMVVQLWMAHGVFVKEPMERIAGLFFEDCLDKGYFLFCRTNLVTGKAMYKFKRDGSVVSLLISSSSHIVLIERSSNLNDVSEEVSHVSIRCYRQKNYTIIQELKRFKQLKTLMFLHGHELSFKQVPRDIFLSLRLLQVLDLSQTHLLELPSSIGNIKCLRYLDLSETLIKRLPEAIDSLENLQTLKLRGCLNLSFLPKGTRKLVNLRHLDLDVRRHLRSMPPGLGNLINIQTLSAFLVDLEEECSIRQLQNMNNLSGSFCISRLENVLTKDEAMEACLCNKSQLTKLELQWSDTQDEDVSVNGEVLSSLKPNTSLEELHISCFDGFDLPSWICDPAFFKLVRITLFKCENCLVLPSLGQLPSLKFLNIVDFYKLKVIDHNFYGGLGNQGFTAFPKLEKLAIENMLSLEKWTGMEKYVFPCLLTLTIKYCPKLSSLHTLSNLCFIKNLETSHCDMLASWTDGRLSASLKTLIIEDCPMISVESLKNGGQDWHKVGHIQNLWVDNQEIPSGAAE